nr:MAG TPA: hypothetical protein [Caudoviricetes sp.]
MSLTRWPSLCGGFFYVYSPCFNPFLAQAKQS